MNRLHPLLLLGLLALPSHGEERYFRFLYPGQDTLSRVTRWVSVDQIREGWVYAYANDKGWSRFSTLGLDAEGLPHPGSLNQETCVTSLRTRAAWDAYPSHTAYVEMMQAFQKNHPNLCEVQTLGKSINGRPLLVARLSGLGKGKPKFFYSAAMHGDETTGYVLLLRLMDFLLTNYNQSTPDGVRATHLLDNLEIWVTPLSNPDGMFRSGDASIQNPTRGNAAGLDLNRNFPDPQDGEHPDGESWQPETVAMMDLARRQRFTMAANLHGGVEVAIYPWATWATPHVDDAWWKAVARRYADSAQAASPAGYFDDQNKGIVKAFDMYEANGSRQDYTNQFLGCREMTLEVSATKFLPAAKLPALWDYNKNALLGCLDEALKGIRGSVHDEQTGQPVAATVALQAPGELPVTADPTHGTFHRILLPGTYTLQVKADGYEPKTLTGVQVAAASPTTLDVKLKPVSASEVPKAAFTFSQGAGSTVQFTDASTCQGGTLQAWAWDFGDGATSKDKNPTHAYAKAGTYTVRLAVTSQGGKSDAVTQSVQVSGAPVSYCPAKSTNTRYFHINKVTVGAFSQTSAASTYSDFTAKVIEMTPGVETSFAIGCGGTTTYRNWYGLWVDLNRDGDFADAGERLFVTENPITGGPSGRITLPVGTAQGQTRLRVIQKNGTSIQPCETFTYGEVEDYTVNIKAASPSVPAVPTGLNATASGAGTLTITWSASAGATGYDLKVDGSEKAGVTSPYAHTGLAAGSTHTYQVRAKNAAGASPWSPQVSGTVNASFVVDFPDANLQSAIRQALNLPSGPIHNTDLAALKTLEATNKSIRDLKGLEYCTNLETLDLRYNTISDISNLSTLTRLQTYRTCFNSISDISVLKHLTSLTRFEITANKVSDPTPLTYLTRLERLDFNQMKTIQDIRFLASMKTLKAVKLNGDAVVDLTPLKSLPGLETLNLEDNGLCAKNTSGTCKTNFEVIQWLKGKTPPATVDYVKGNDAE